jgi:hypothetical protein
MRRSRGAGWTIQPLLTTIFIITGATPIELSAQTLGNNSNSERPPVSICQAVANAPSLRNIVTVAGEPLAKDQVRISYIGHSTYYIETPGDISIATDYDGSVGGNSAPTAATMNKAHSSHYTLYPDPEIEHVLPGWNPNGGPIAHNLVIGDTYIRNVTTDILSGFSGSEPDGNSIFIFEVAGLCIGHLGHLHHKLDDRHIAQIGRLDVVMVPIDGGLTLGHESIGETVKRLRASIILPMHRRGAPISQFLELFGDDFGREFLPEDNFTISLRTLPKQPTIVVLNGV